MNYLVIEGEHMCNLLNVNGDSNTQYNCLIINIDFFDNVAVDTDALIWSSGHNLVLKGL